MIDTATYGCSLLLLVLITTARSTDFGFWPSNLFSSCRRIPGCVCSDLQPEISIFIFLGPVKRRAVGNYGLYPSSHDRLYHSIRLLQEAVRLDCVRNKYTFAARPPEYHAKKTWRLGSHRCHGFFYFYSLDGGVQGLIGYAATARRSGGCITNQRWLQQLGLEPSSNITRS